jgi:ferrous iron transport protein A
LKFIFNSVIVLIEPVWNRPISGHFERLGAMAILVNSIPSDTSTLSQLPVGTMARVMSIGGSGAIARRLMEMGVVPGAPVRVIKSAPLGGPLEIWVRGYHLALRKAEAQTILVSSEQ